MFINISNNLPKTAYVKMIDAWLIFNLLKPFVDIIIQTYMETLRTDDKSREINHHGQPLAVGEAKVIPVLQSDAIKIPSQNQLK